MNIIRTNNSETLHELESDSALTWEGLAEGSIAEAVEWIKGLTPLKREDVYVTSGSLMNRTYGLTGSNAYPDDLNIVSVKLSDMEDYNKVVMPRFEVGGRWFDDIVDSNVRRERQ